MGYQYWGGQGAPVMMNSGMGGFGGASGLGTIIAFVVLIDLVLLAIWLGQQIKK